MQIYCRSCDKEIQAENINLDKMIAKCSHCNAVFSFADMYEGVEAKPKVKYADMPIPMGIAVHYEEGYLLIERKWSSCSGYFLIVFAIIWNSAIWGIFIPSTIDEIFSPFILFLAPFVLIGVFVAYMGFANLLNTTKIRVDNEALDIRHEPLPFPSTHLAVGDIQQLFTRQHVSHSKNSTSISYSLTAILTDGREAKLLETLEKAEFALFMEQEIENYLGIENYPVRGEYQ